MSIFTTISSAKKGILSGFLGGGSGIDLDLGCLFELKNLIVKIKFFFNRIYKVIGQICIFKIVIINSTMKVIINFIKPGIGETTRVLLRRIPWKILINEKNKNDFQLEGIKRLAKERNAP